MNGGWLITWCQKGVLSESSLDLFSSEELDLYQHLRAGILLSLEDSLLSLEFDVLEERISYWDTRCRMDSASDQSCSEDKLSVSLSKRGRGDDLLWSSLLELSNNFDGIQKSIGISKSNIGGTSSNDAPSSQPCEWSSLIHSFPYGFHFIICIFCFIISLQMFHRILFSMGFKHIAACMHFLGESCNAIICQTGDMELPFGR